MSKRVADFQLTSENYDLEERKLCGLSSKEGDKNDEGIGGDVIENKEEISTRKIVRIRKRYDDFGDSGSLLTPDTATNSDTIPVISTFGKDLKDEKSGICDNIIDSSLNGKQNKEEERHENQDKDEEEKNENEGKKNENEEKKNENEEEKNENEEEKNENEEKKNENEEKKNEEESSDKNGDEAENKEEENRKEEILPFGNSGLSSSFKNPFVSLAANTENSNFLFSGFSGATKNNSVGIFGASGGDGTGATGGEEDEENNEEANEEPEVESKAFTGEEHEETVYQCKNVDLFMLKVLENEEKSFRKLATGIIHLNIPKDQNFSGFSETSDKNEDPLEDQASKTITQPRIIFRQKGIYKVLLNSLLNPEISKTFQRNSNIRKGYAVNFIAFGPESEIQQCMLRFQNESDLIDFTDKVHQVVHQHYSKSE
ncbi:hypothetical protein CmeUKMEL1_14995 [Cryptosporidium meleagridis]|uniref:RanBD1 domain-containing protein n=1 Tax=Cryptosporidium meleagridis TaxID=93969 RepID=A0A2P4Z4F1_9CRYT|nr:hypothetical protein CmeUKMEL1_14995 [Cryptosporidium meleagridis]